MARITVAEANAWSEPTKLTLTPTTFNADAELEQQIASQILSRLMGTFDTSTWTSETTTPKIVRTIIAMYFVSWIYDRAYSDDAEANAYAALLRQYADANIAGLIAGQIDLEEFPDANVGVGSPSFFPTDASSARVATPEAPSDGPPSFTMGTVF